MECPKCKSVLGLVGEQSGRTMQARDAVTYNFKCTCGHSWSERYGTRRRGTWRKNLSNVEMRLNAIQQKFKERSDKINAGICPECDTPLTQWIDMKTKRLRWCPKDCIKITSLKGAKDRE